MSAHQNNLLKIVTNVVTETTNPQKFSLVFSATIICLVYNCIENPEGAVNQFMILLIDMVYNLFPSTPTTFTVGYMLRQFAAEHPYIGWGSIYEIFSGMSTMFGLWCVVKLWQLLPFT